jgi:hypothetical protein
MGTTSKLIDENQTGILLDLADKKSTHDRKVDEIWLCQNLIAAP